MCSDTCSYAGDEDCDDGGPGSHYSMCAFGSDCTDCGPRCDHGGNALGHPSYCSEACPCGHGEGDCDNDAQCTGGATCTDNIGATYGWSPGIDVCLVPTHAPTRAPTPCDHGGNALGHPSYCSEACPCEHEEGDCDNDAQCTGGTTCTDNIGATYGWSAGTDVCLVPTHAPTRAPTLAPTLAPTTFPSTNFPTTFPSTDFPTKFPSKAPTRFPTTCNHDGRPPGDPSYCSEECPCGHGEGDCDNDDQCIGEATCTDDVGDDWGMPTPTTDVCLEDEDNGDYGDDDYGRRALAEVETEAPANRALRGGE